MKVAIIGAGISGLCCAHELERQGIKYDIYERNSYIGEQFQHVSAMLKIIHRPVPDYVQYFKERFDINLNYLDQVNNIIHYSPNKARNISGNLGYLFKRGKQEDTVKNQLFNQLKNPNLILNTFGDYNVLSKKYDYVVNTTGNINFCKELGNFQTWIRGFVKGAVIHGSFKTNEMSAWVNKDYCKTGYAYLTPFDTKKACLVLIVPYVNEKEINNYWEKFLFAENLKYEIIEEFKLEHVSGYSYPFIVDNIISAGGAAGMIDPFLGFGKIRAVSMGVFAGKAIALGEDYNKLVKPLVKQNIRLHEFRRAYNKLSNKDLDKMITILAMPGVKQLIYNTPVNVAQYGYYALKLINKKKKG